MVDLILSPEAVLDQIVVYPFNAVHPAPPMDLLAEYTTVPNNPNTRAVRITWTAPENTPDVASYKIYKNDRFLAEVSTTEYYDQVSSGEVEYVSYYITTVDVLGNEGEFSDVITNLSLRVNDLVDRLRRVLKDDPSDPRVRRWPDELILECLLRARDDINATPLRTSFNFDNWPDNLMGLLIQGARIYAVQTQATEEAAKEFSMGVGGISMNLSRTGLYLNISAQEIQMYEKQRDKVKLNFVMTVAGEGILSAGLVFRIRTYAPRQYRVR